MPSPARSSTARSLGALVMLTLAACSGDDGASSSAEGGNVSGQVVVFAAASLTEAFTELGDEFAERHPGSTVTFNFGASSELATQILEGAPVDVFASADLPNMARLTEADATSERPVVFATNRPAIVVGPDNPLGISGVGDLADDELILVTCAPEVPCGAYAARIFELAGVTPTPDSYEENVKAVVTKVALGEADAGIAYSTDVRSAGDRATGVEIPAELGVIAEYPVAPIVEARNPSGGQAFVDLLLGDAGRAVLADHGFGAP